MLGSDKLKFISLCLVLLYCDYDKVQEKENNEKKKKNEIINIKLNHRKIKIKETGSYKGAKNSNLEIINPNISAQYINPYTQTERGQFGIYFSLKLNLDKKQYLDDNIISYKIDGKKSKDGKEFKKEHFKIVSIQNNEYMYVWLNKRSKYSRLKTFIQETNQENIYELDCKIVLEKLPENSKIFTIEIIGPNIPDGKYIVDLDLTKVKRKKKNKTTYHKQKQKRYLKQ